MLGNRGSSDGIETDAFSRKSRAMLHWQRGELRRIKRAFSKRQRKIGKQLIANQVAMRKEDVPGG